MAIREIVKIGQPVLRQRATKVNRFSSGLRTLIDDMVDTMRAAPMSNDGSGWSVPEASVTAQWTLPNGNVTTMTAKTSSAGRARFVVTSTRGTYTLIVTNVTRSGYTFDAAGSVLSKSITT